MLTPMKNFFGAGPAASGPRSNMPAMTTRTVPNAISDPIIAVRVLPHGSLHVLDTFRYQGKRLPRISIGRSEHAEIRLDDECVSARHCFLFRKGERVYVEPMYSKNDVLVNEVPVHHGMAEILPGFVIRMGETRLLACGAAGEKQEALITSAGVQAYLREAIELYGSQRNASHFLGIAQTTLSQWLRFGRFQEERRARKQRKAKRTGA